MPKTGRQVHQWQKISRQRVESRLQNQNLIDHSRPSKDKEHDIRGQKLIAVKRSVKIVRVLIVTSILSVSATGIDFRLDRFPDALVLPLRDGTIEELMVSHLGLEIEADGIGKETDLGNNTLTSYQTKSYTVKVGDTISEIAYRFGLSIGTIISYNSIADARKLQEGAELRIPPQDGVIYRVKANDTLSDIAARFDVALTDILDANGIESSVIKPYDILHIPNASIDQMALQSALGTLFVWPMQVDGRLSSYFGERNDPFTGAPSRHNGIDIAIGTGAPVIASSHGAVVATGFGSVYGNYVILQHHDGFQTHYAHLSRISVSRGQSVNQGQKIGEVGNTGRSTGPHLHFGIYYRQEAIDPLKKVHQTHG